MSEHDEDHKKESKPVWYILWGIDIMQRQIMSATRKLPGR